MDYFLNGLQQSREGETDPEWETLYSFYRQDPKYRSRVQALMRAALKMEWQPRFLIIRPGSCMAM